MEQEKIGKFIKNIRTSNNLTQKEFADKFGVTYQAVSKWENGKNLPDINILKEICKEYSISIDEVLMGNSDKINNKFKLKILLLIIIGIILIILGVIFYFNNTNYKEFEFKKISSTCDKFKVTGSIAYNDIKSSIYIAHVDYCGENEEVLYKEMKCIFYEVDGDVKKEISKYNYNEGKGITIEEFLSGVTFNIDDYEKVCKIYQENSFLLEIEALNENGDIIKHKIPLKLEDNCST